MSLLRVAGLVVAALIVFTVARGLSRRSPSFTDLLGFGAAALLVLVSLVPSMATLPAELVDLGHARGGRLITLLLWSSLALWPYVFWSNERHRRALDRAGRQLEALTVRVVALGAPQTVAPVAVVLPAYNEERAVAAVVRSLPDEIDGLPVQAIVVADGCTDATAQQARAAGAVVLELPLNRGGGAAIRLGYAYAVGAGARAVATMDADGQHRPQDLAAVVGPVLRGEADFVIGSRCLGAHERVSGARSVGLRFFNAVLSLLLATRLTDCSSGFRAFDAERMPRLATREDQYHTAETIILARRLGLRVAEAPITAPRRLAGASKKGGDLIYGYRFASVILTHWLRG